MLKLLLLALAVWLVIGILKQRRVSTHPAPQAEKPVAEKSANMVRCDICGVHLPESEAILSNRLHYCCEAHFLQRKHE